MQKKKSKPDFLMKSLPVFSMFFSDQLYRSDSDSSTLPRKSPFVRNTLERRTLRYKQVCLAKWSLVFIKLLEH